MKNLSERDRILLVKILNMTSANDKDGEMMNAIRAANNLLRRNNMQWEDVIEKVKVIPRGNDLADQLRAARAAAESTFNFNIRRGAWSAGNKY